MPTLEDVRAIAATLPDSEERATTGGAAWFVRNRLYAWEAHPWPSIPADVRAIIERERISIRHWANVPVIHAYMPQDDAPPPGPKPPSGPGASPKAKPSPGPPPIPAPPHRPERDILNRFLERLHLGDLDSGDLLVLLLLFMLFRENADEELLIALGLLLIL